MKSNSKKHNSLINKELKLKNERMKCCCWYEKCGNESLFTASLFWSLLSTEVYNITVAFFKDCHPSFVLSFSFVSLSNMQPNTLGYLLLLFFYWTRFKILPLLTNYCHVPLIIISLLWTFTMKIWLEIATMASPIVSVYNKYYNHSCFMCCGGLIRSIFWLWLQTQIVNDFNSCTVHVRRLFQQQP